MRTVAVRKERVELTIRTITKLFSFTLEQKSLKHYYEHCHLHQTVLLHLREECQERHLHQNHTMRSISITIVWWKTSPKTWTHCIRVFLETEPGNTGGQPNTADDEVKEADGEEACPTRYPTHQEEVFLSVDFKPQGWSSLNLVQQAFELTNNKELGHPYGGQNFIAHGEESLKYGRGLCQLDSSISRG